MEQITVIVGNVRRTATKDTALTVAEVLVNEQGGPGVAPVPTFEGLGTAPDVAIAKDGFTPGCVTCDTVSGPCPTHHPLFKLTDSGPRVADIKAGEMDVVGRSRSVTDKAAAEKAGFTLKDTVYERGLRVNSTGVTNAQEFRQDYEKEPLTSAELKDLETVVKAEARQDLAPVRIGLLRANVDGRLLYPRVSGGVVTYPTSEEQVQGSYVLTSRAVKGLVGRLECGGGEYLAEHCSPELLAKNINHQCRDFETAEQAREAKVRVNNEKTDAEKQRFRPTEARLRTRTRAGIGSECFAVVSPGYSALDADILADIIAEALPPEARGRVKYDAQNGRFRAEAWLHSTVAPENYVAGEVFRAGLIIKADDTGNGGIEIDGGIGQNLCLNLIILDNARRHYDTIVHKGVRDSLIAKVRSAIDEAVKSLEHFRESWGYAAAKDVTAPVAEAATAEGIRLSRELALASVFRGVLQRQLVKLPGRKEDRIEQLVDAWKGDRSSATVSVPTSKAAVVNAFTRVAHTTDLDAWQQDQVCADAGKLLNRKGDLPFEFSKDQLEDSAEL